MNANAHLPAVGDTVRTTFVVEDVDRSDDTVMAPDGLWYSASDVEVVKPEPTTETIPADWRDWPGAMTLQGYVYRFHGGKAYHADPGDGRGPLVDDMTGWQFTRADLVYLDAEQARRLVPVPELDGPSWKDAPAVLVNGNHLSAYLLRVAGDVVEFWGGSQWGPVVKLARHERENGWVVVPLDAATVAALDGKDQA